MLHACFARSPWAAEVCSTCISSCDHLTITCLSPCVHTPHTPCDDQQGLILALVARPLSISQALAASEHGPDARQSP
jgi:hypothetical protein